MVPRVFVHPDRVTETIGQRHVVVEGDDAHHIHRVLRLQVGDLVWVADGTGVEYPGTIEAVEKHAVRLRLGEARSSAGEPAYRLTLFQGLPKSDKMDWVVQKASEVGVSTVVPITTERSVITLSAAKAVGRVGRWRRIAESAAQQAARGRIPSISDLASLSEALDTWRSGAPDGLLLVPWEEEQTVGLRELLRSAAPVASEIGILIGPEGGLTPDEVKLAVSVGGRACTLGPRILRTETAGAVVAALILYDLGEMGG